VNEFMFMRIFTTLLSYDHGILRQVLDVLGEMVERNSWEQHRDVLPEVVDFLQRFMDQYHHGKEERYLFPTAPPGEADLKEQIDDLVREHRQAKDYADAIEEGVARWDLDVLRDNTGRLVAHMQHHILEEEDMVFPAFDGVMDPEVDMSIHEQSQRFMEENFGASFQADMEAFANKLQDRVMGKGVIKYGP
jgi:hemerythrin-like domain-containing protein